MAGESKITVTSALPYANGPIHIGHLAGVYVPADIFVRYNRSAERDILFVCGSDEHGVPITLRARKEGVSPQQIVDKYHSMIKESFQEFGITFDIYSRTSSPVHHKTAADFFTKLYDDNKFVEKTNEQYYDEKEGQFLADRYIVGTCPNCNFDNAFGDQCERCGTSLSPDELINPVSALSGTPPIKKETSHWYIPLDQYEDWLREWIVDGHKKDWKINVYGQCKSWIDQGLKPRAVTRDLDWGVKVPLKEASGKVLYVWFDAPIGYISATKEWAEKTGNDWEPYWKGENTRLLHFIGKDNIVFHCIIFPAMLKAHGEYILPENVPANEFLNLEGDKISTSRNWAVWLHEFLEDFPGKQDVMRYTLCANAPETKDNDFTWKDFQTRNNSELASILGNFVKRAIDFTTKNFDCKVPPAGDPISADEELDSVLAEAPDKIATSIENYRFREAMINLMEVARAGNKYLAETEPWKLIKEDRAQAGHIMNQSLLTVANLAILCEPFLPFTATAINEMLKQVALPWKHAGRKDLLDVGRELGESVVLFSRIEDDEIERQVAKLSKDENDQKEVEIKPEIVFDDFLKLDIRTGTIEEASKVEKSKKLIKITVDLGFEKRTILSGIAEHFSPDDLPGKQVSVVVNLAPRKMMGIESQGMILLAEDENNNLIFVTPENPIENGSAVR